MPIVNVKLIEGRSDEQLRGLVNDVTEAVHKNAKAPKENIHIIIEEMKPEHYGVAGVRKSDS